MLAHLAPLEMKIGLKARFLGSDGCERTGIIASRKLTPLRIEVTDGRKPGANGRMVLYMELLGRVEGDATWHGTRIIEFAMIAAPAKLERIERQLGKIAAMPPDERSEARANRRIEPVDPDTSLVLDDGGRFNAMVLNMSRSGALIQTSAEAALNTIITIGRTRAKVVRQQGDAIAVAFLRLLPIDEFDVGFKL